MGSEAREGSQDGLVAQLGRVLHSQFANQGVVGWVVEVGGCAAGWAHSSEEYALSSFRRLYETDSVTHRKSMPAS